LLGVTAAEVLTNLVAPAVGLIVHGLLLLALLGHSALTPSKRLQRLLLALSLVPLTRLLSLSVPLPNFPAIFVYLIVGLPLSLGAFAVVRLAGYSRRQIGLSVGAWPTQLLVGLTGLGLGYVEYRILQPEPLIEAPTLANLWLPVLILGLFTGLLEEVVFRGLVQYAASVVLGRWGLVFVAALFAVLHIGYRSGLDLAFVLAVGLFFAVVVERTRSILGVALAHAVTNIALFLIMPFVVQGPPPAVAEPAVRFELVALERGSRNEPGALAHGQAVTATVTITNIELDVVSYTVFATADGHIVALSPIISLAGGEVARQALRFDLPETSGSELVVVSLHRNGRPEPTGRIRLVIAAGPGPSP
jgi:membrane protease YdiL (CAAX protease family)